VSVTGRQRCGNEVGGRWERGWPTDADARPVLLAAMWHHLARCSPSGPSGAPGDFPTNRGGLCSKGWTAAELLDHPERLTEPLVRDRRDAPLRPTTWDDAPDRVAHAVRRSQQHHGPDGVGCFGGGGLTNEKAYQLGKFARVALRTSQIDYNGR